MGGDDVPSPFMFQIFPYKNLETAWRFFNFNIRAKSHFVTLVPG